MHLFMRDFAEVLAPTVGLLPDRSPESNEDFGPARMALRTDGQSGFLFVNNHVRGYPQPDRTNVQVAVEMAGREIRVPREPVTIPSSAYFIWPVFQSMEDSLLLYATAQPLCLLENGDDKTYVFVQTITERPEYIFDPRTISGHKTRFSVQPGLDSMLAVKTREGKQVYILTLTREQALKTSKVELKGREYLIVSDGNVVLDVDHLALFTSGPGPLTLAILPFADLVGKGLSSAGSEGNFARYNLIPKVPDVVNPEIVRAGTNQWTIKIGDVQKGARMRVTYTGDVAELYLGNRLIYDNFYSGEVFEAGLDRFSDELRNELLTLKISPMAASKKVYLDVPCPEGNPVLDSVELQVEARISFRLAD